jgi:hypothetical protein
MALFVLCVPSIAYQQYCKYEDDYESSVSRIHSENASSQIYGNCRLLGRGPIIYTIRNTRFLRTMAKKQLSDVIPRIREAAAEGETSVVESLLAFVSSDIGPAEADAAAHEALSIAVANHKKALAAYLTDVIADTERAPRGGTDEPMSEDMNILAAIRDTSKVTDPEDNEPELISVFVCPCQLATHKEPPARGGSKIYPEWHILGGAP